jgi:hypothetical protein
MYTYIYIYIYVYVYMRTYATPTISWACIQRLVRKRSLVYCADIRECLRAKIYIEIRERHGVAATAGILAAEGLERGNGLRGSRLRVLPSNSAQTIFNGFLCQQMHVFLFLFQ